MICSFGNVDFNCLRIGMMIEEDWSCFMIVVGKLLWIKIFIDDMLGICINDLCFKCCWFK